MTNAAIRQAVFLYGPSGSGKSTVGRILSEALGRPFIDLDEMIESRTGLTIPEIFNREDEAGFRQKERSAFQEMIHSQAGVVALGGGALLDADSRAQAEANGTVLCLWAPYETLQARLKDNRTERPLLAIDMPERLRALLAKRAGHYASFPQLDTARISAEEAAWQVQVRLGRFHVRGMGQGYDVFVHRDGIDCLGEFCQQAHLKGPLALVSDDRVGPLYARRAAEALEAQGYAVHSITIPAGETFKTPATVQSLWEQLTAAGLERQSTVVALGGGVVNDIAGFAAATFLRGVRWVTCPTSLLAMVDASLGGKTGVDLPQGKNLVGAFYPPSLVLADPTCLETLPMQELRSGLAEVVKHGVIGDPELFERCASLQMVNGKQDPGDWGEIVRRAMAVKVRVIQADPFEQGPRATLNLGHTLGHALEQATNYALRHGEAVAIGMVAAARLAQKIGLAENGLAEAIRSVLEGLGLPTQVPPGLDHSTLLQAMRRDKKRAAGKLRFALPIRLGQVIAGVEIDEGTLESILKNG